MTELANRVAVVTGAARNIGRAIACDLAAGGASVVLVARADKAGLDETAALIRAHGGRAEVILADITDQASVRALAVSVESLFGRLDILVSNAALRAEHAFEEITLAQWREVMAVNLDGAFLTTQALMGLLRKSDAGAIINMGGQFGLLIDGQTRLDAPGVHVAQSVGPELVEPVNPVPQGLPIDAADARSVRAVHAIQHRRQ